MSLAFSISTLFSLEAVYVLTGIVLLIFAALTLLDRSNPKRRGTAAFWLILGLIFALGGVLPYWLTGLLVLFLVALDGAGQVGKGEAPAAQSQAGIGNKIFWPVLSIPLVTFAFAIVFRLLKLDANRGALINSYSSSCTGLCSGSSMPDNNGNLKQQDIQIPSVSTRSQYYEYDSLNRLKSAREVVSAVEQWKQQFTYDRWGNRLIDNAVTYGTGINNKAFTVNTAPYGTLWRSRSRPCSSWMMISPERAITTSSFLLLVT